MSPGLLDETAEVQSSCPFFRAREAAESWAEGRTGAPS